MSKRSRLSSAVVASAAVLGLPGLVSTVEAQVVPFTAGDVAVYRVGTGTALSSAATAVFIDEYSPTGTLVQSVPLPTAAGNGNNPLTASGSATSEGLLTLSANGQYLIVPGYDAAVGTSGVASSTSATVPREIGTIDVNGTINTTTTTTAFSGNNIRGATSPDGQSLYAVGAATGVVLQPLGGSGAGTVISSTITNARELLIQNNQLYESTGSGSVRGIYAVGSGVPTTTGQTSTAVAGTIAAASSPYSFAFATLAPGATSPDTVYIADSTAGLQKFSLVGSAYAVTGVDAISGATGITIRPVAGTSNVQIFVTSPTGIFSLLDTSGYDNTLSAGPAQIATATTNEAFRGIAFAPTAVPEPTALAVAMGFGLMMSRRRRI